MDASVLWTVLVIVVILITVLNGYFVIRLQTLHPELHVELGRPGVLFFLSGKWLTSPRFTKFILSRKSSGKLSGDRELLFLKEVLAATYLLMLLCWLAVMISVFYEMRR